LPSQGGNYYGAHLRTGLTPVSFLPPSFFRERSLTRAAVLTRGTTEKKEAERMNKQRRERKREKERERERERDHTKCKKKPEVG